MCRLVPLARERRFVRWMPLARMTVDRRSAFLTRSGEGYIAGRRSLGDSPDFELLANGFALFPQSANFVGVAANQRLAERGDLG